VYMSWADTQKFVREVRQNVTESEGSAEQKASGQVDFALLARAAERVGEQFGTHQDQECQQMKASLIKISDRGTGRVRLSEFYKPALDGHHFQFQESAAYLRQLGALDESDPENPRVIIPNFITSPTNCIASSSFYSVCCMDECEGLLSHLEQEIAGPEASSTQIAGIVAKLASSTVAAPRTLPPILLSRLGEIAAEHDGMVPLHGRLFAQWMHHAFPQECIYPHVADTTNPQSPDEWLKENGEEHMATDEEMSGHVEKAKTENPPHADNEELEIAPLPWAHVEELIVPSQKTGKVKRSTMRNIALFTAMVGAAYGLTHNLWSSSKAAKLQFSEKHFV